MVRQVRPAVIALALLTVLTGVAYPLVVTGIAQVGFEHEANGSRLHVVGRLAGSELVAQPFDGPAWFQPRPSAADHDAATSGGSNLGPTNPDLLAIVARRADDYRRRNGLSPDTAVPVDAVTASGSGLDPHVSPRNARLQAPRVASVRGLSLTTVMELVDASTEGRTFGVLGETRVNVMRLNARLALVAP